MSAGAVTACSGSDSSSNRSASSSAVSSASAGGAEAGNTAAEAKLRMVDNGGHRVAFYVARGNSSTIVLDSGGGEYSSQWKDIAPKLHAATGATVITYDRAGLGKSDVVPGPWKVESAVSDLKAGLQQLGVTHDVTLVAHSQAGEIAGYLAKDDPKLLSGAVLIDANLPQFFADEEPPSRSRVPAGRRRREEGSREAGEPPAHLYRGGLRRSAPGIPQGCVAGLGPGNGPGVG
ncbi:alpha/beta fold hydrolase [Streptomyces sp. NPDC095817]|uniref:alpha/beta fold hydrolase n=1 Tax=Streptomyces sp. NPDC095817 TaxID=3155082 RepID=UPI00333059BF